MSASAVFGQSSFNTCAPNRGGAAGASTLNYPEGVFEDDTGRVFIADSYNHRVLVYEAPFLRRRPDGRPRDRATELQFDRGDQPACRERSVQPAVHRDGR